MKLIIANEAGHVTQRVVGIESVTLDPECPGDLVLIGTGAGFQARLRASEWRHILLKKEEEDLSEPLQDDTVTQNLDGIGVRLPGIGGLVGLPAKGPGPLL